MAYPPAARSAAASFEFPSTARAARHAARTWFESAPNLPPAQYRDQQFRAHCADKTDSPLERRVRRAAFKQAFAEAMGHIVVEEARFHALAA
ncbi:hypothetical protein DVB37_20530 [Achromobacter sp. B7]|uniref:hypothetical protein n=1 Tax=Achromobacter sp. B7 TaxID=2282475 RepID=UPI000E715D6A|nr:hypothetical protein [Achromobacter sp. B7]AYD66042.1 hypothetical protein DVB37_20530 [Achromobacter sp. B7]